MKRTLTILILSALSFLTASALAVDLKKLNLDHASVIGPTIETETLVKAEGKGSVKITTRWPATVCLGEVGDLEVENATLIYNAKVKSDLKGTAYLEMWAQVGSNQYFSRGMNDMVNQRSEWKTIQTPFAFQKGQKPEKIALNLVINGTGTVWVDDIVLSKESLR